MRANFENEEVSHVVPWWHNMSALADLRPSFLLQNQTLVPKAKQEQRSLLGCLENQTNFP